jgi:ADP-L-glycero-D-manno-heptose 6-epimerase
MRNNFQLSMNLFKWCGINRVRFIYASSAATYGGGGQGFEDDSSRQALAELRPLNVYGWSKHLFDRALAQIRAQENKAYPIPPQCVGLKFFNVYGPNEYHKGGQMSVVAHLFQQIQAKKSAQLFKSNHPDYPDGGQLRDFIFVEDCIEIMLWLYDNPNVSGLYNVGTGRARSFEDLALAVYAAMGVKPSIIYKDMPAELKGKYQYFTQAEMENLRKAGYKKPFTPLEEGIKTYVQQFLMAEDPYR